MEYKISKPLMEKSCRTCGYPLKPHNLNLLETLFMCGNDKCTFPFEEENIDQWIVKIQSNTSNPLTAVPNPTQLPSHLSTSSHQKRKHQETTTLPQKRNCINTTNNTSQTIRTQTSKSTPTYASTNSTPTSSPSSITVPSLKTVPTLKNTSSASTNISTLSASSSTHRASVSVPSNTALSTPAPLSNTSTLPSSTTRLAQTVPTPVSNTTAQSNPRTFNGVPSTQLNSPPVPRTPTILAELKAKMQQPPSLPSYPPTSMRLPSHASSSPLNSSAAQTTSTTNGFASKLASTASQYSTNQQSIAMNGFASKATSTPSQYSTQNPKDSLLNTIQQLRRGGWLNDEVVNGYFELLSKRYPSTGFLSSFFLVHTNSDKWSSTQSVVNAFKKGEKDKLVFPFHTPGHWMLIVIDGKAEEYSLLDASALHHTAPSSIVNWLNTTFSDKLWTFSLPFGQAHQTDAENCGVFTCLYAECVAKNQSFEEINRMCKNIDIRASRASILNQLEQYIRTGSSTSAAPAFQLQTGISPAPVTSDSMGFIPFTENAVLS